MTHTAREINQAIKAAETRGRCLYAYNTGGADSTDKFWLKVTHAYTDAGKLYVVGGFTGQHHTVCKDTKFDER